MPFRCRLSGGRDRGQGERQAQWAADEDAGVGRRGGVGEAHVGQGVQELVDADLDLGLGQQRADAEVPAEREGEMVGGGA